MNEDFRQSKFDAYGHLSDQNASFTEQNGRYPAQSQFEKLIFLDVLKKLNLKPENQLLDIGCGMGNILIPACFVVENVTGIDHPKVIEKLNSVFKKDNCHLTGGDFIDLPIQKKFDRIVSYCVLPALPHRDVVMSFIDKALNLLTDDGLLLLADLANIDKKKRFFESLRGKSFSLAWERRIRNMPTKIDPSDVHKLPTVIFDDQFMIDICLHIRKRGFHAYILNQPQNLPFGNTREDILVVGPEYNDGTDSIKS